MSIEDRKSYFSAIFPSYLRVFLKNVKCCFGFLFEKMSKLRGVENAHTWPHMVRLTQRSTSKIFASFSSVRCTKRLMSAKFSLEAAQCSRLSQRSVWQRKNSRATPTPPRSCKFSAQKFANSLLVDLWVRRTMYPSTYRCQNDHWRKISPSKNCSVRIA